MKYNNWVFCIFLIVTSSHAMEIYQDIIAEIGKSEIEFARNLNNANSFEEFMGAGESHYQHLEKIVMSAGNMMPNAEKLEYLLGFTRWKLRKSIITEMVERENNDPNFISYSDNTTPLLDSVTNQDFSFTHYLLTKGALITQEIIAKTTSHEISLLLKTFNPQQNL